MKDKESLHKKVNELADCFATTDPLKEMGKLVHDEDTEEAALKWLALATLHGVNQGAKTISIHRSDQGEVKVMAKYHEKELPSPGNIIGEKILTAIRSITHMEKTKDKTLLAVGIRDSDIELKVELKNDESGEKATMKFTS